MAKVRVLHLIQDLKTGGLERVAAQIVSGLDRNMFEAELWCLSAGGPLERVFKDKVPVIRIFDYRRYLLPWNIISLANSIRKGKFDIVHTHSYPPGIFGRVSAKLAGVKGIFHHHHTTSSAIMNNYRTLFERFVSRFLTDRIIACSAATKDFILKNRYADEGKIRIIYNGVPAEFSEPSGRRDELELRLGLKGKTTLISVGSLTVHKGHIHLLNALKKVASAFPDIRLVIVGEGPERKNLEQYIKDNDLQANVILAGHQDDPRLFLEISDVFVLPSLREAMPVSLIEAMAKELPAVGSRVDGITEVIKENVTGITVTPADGEKLAESILYLLRNKNIAAEMGEKGFERYKELFTFEMMIDNIQGLYLECLSDKEALPKPAVK